MDPCMQDERIARIEQSVEQLSKDVGKVSADVGTLTELVKDGLLKKVERHEQALNGFEDEPGLISTQKEQSKTVGELVDTLRGKDLTPGLIGAVFESVKAIKSMQDSMTWLNRLIIGGVILAILGLVLAK